MCVVRTCTRRTWVSDYAAFINKPAQLTPELLMLCLVWKIGKLPSVVVLGVQYVY